jgi:Domain of unknown function (DUF6134)
MDMHRSALISAGSAFATALAFALPSPALAATKVLTYNVEHPTYGNIGTYINTVSQDGNAADVRTDLHIAVKVIGIELFHQDATREERWNNDHLVSFQSTTDDDGAHIAVTGKAEATGFLIQSSTNGTLTAPARVHPSNPWAPFVLQTDTMMSTKSGKITSVVVKDTGEVTMTFDGRAMRVHQWFVDDDKHQVVWIDDRGTVVAFQTNEKGTPINFVLKSDTAAIPPPAALANN